MKISSASPLRRRPCPDAGRKAGSRRQQRQRVLPFPLPAGSCGQAAAGNPKGQPLRARGLPAGLVIAAFILCYGLLTKDIPVIYLAFSFIIYVLAPVLGKLSPAHSQAIQQAARSFSITTFLGAIIMAMV